MQVLALCFEYSKEANGDVCWEDCVHPAAERFDSCEGFCNAVDQCRGKKCSSGPACESHYYELVNCAVEGCTCTGSGNTEEQDTLADLGGIESFACQAEAKVGFLFGRARLNKYVSHLNTSKPSLHSTICCRFSMTASTTLAKKMELAVGKNVPFQHMKTSSRVTAFALPSNSAGARSAALALPARASTMIH